MHKSLSVWYLHFFFAVYRNPVISSMHKRQTFQIGIWIFFAIPSPIALRWDFCAFQKNPNTNDRDNLAGNQLNDTLMASPG